MDANHNDTLAKSMEDDDAESSKLSSGTGTNTASNIYEIINRAVNKEKLTIAWPRTLRKRLIYLFSMPLTHS